MVWELLRENRGLGAPLWTVALRIYRKLHVKLYKNMKNEAKTNQDPNEMILIDHSMIFQ